MRYVKDTAKTIVFENKIAYKNELYKKIVENMTKKCIYIKKIKNNESCEKYRKIDKSYVQYCKNNAFMKRIAIRMH